MERIGNQVIEPVNVTFQRTFGPRAMNEIVTLRLYAGLAACVFAGTGVLAGAFGAHALRDHLGTGEIAIWQTAVDYQFWHALALLAIACLARAPARALSWSAVAFVAGILIFSGSLYALALGAPRFVGMLTPFGGLSFLVGWSCLLLNFVRSDHH